MTRRFKLLTAICIVFPGSIVSMTCALKRSGQQDQTSRSALIARATPLTISMSITGGMRAGGNWQLDVNPSGEARLAIHTFPSSSARHFTVTEEQLSTLREALARERFFDLDNEYGERVPDGSTTTIIVKAGEKSNAVNLHYLMNWVHGDRERLREPARALRVGRVIRDWFDDPGAVDSRKYDAIVIAAAPD